MVTLHDDNRFELAVVPAWGIGWRMTRSLEAANGTIAADEFNFAENAGGIVRGPIINYSDLDFKLNGNSHLQIDRLTYTQDPPGLTSQGTLSVDAGTYEEY